MHIPRQVRSLVDKRKGRYLVANRDFRRGEAILPLKGVVRRRRRSGPDAVQIGEDSFIDSDYRYAEDHICHSCSPSTRIDFVSMRFVALRHIKKGEEIAYNYLTTEYDMVRDKTDFTCFCGSENCLGRIEGFRFLENSQKMELEPLLSPFLKRKLRDTSEASR